jgi:hypothetical protein
MTTETICTKYYLQNLKHPQREFNFSHSVIFNIFSIVIFASYISILDCLINLSNPIFLKYVPNLLIDISSHIGEVVKYLMSLSTRRGKTSQYMCSRGCEFSLPMTGVGRLVWGWNTDYLPIGFLLGLPRFHPMVEVQTLSGLVVSVTDWSYCESEIQDPLFNSDTVYPNFVVYYNG